MKIFGLKNTKHARTPISTNLKLNKDTLGKDIDQTLYRNMIGNLLYLTASRLNIVFSAGVHFQACPKESHLFIVKRIIKYVNGTLGYGIWFTLDTNADIAGYTDAEWVGFAMIVRVPLEGVFI